MSDTDRLTSVSIIPSKEQLQMISDILGVKIHTMCIPDTMDENGCCVGTIITEPILIGTHNASYDRTMFERQFERMDIASYYPNENVRPLASDAETRKMTEPFVIAEKGFDIMLLLISIEHPFIYKDVIESILIDRKFIGVFYIDALMHFGNTTHRFMKCEFDGQHITSNDFIKISKKSELRIPLCEYFRKNDNRLMYSGLSMTQIKMIRKGINV